MSEASGGGGEPSQSVERVVMWPSRSLGQQGRCALLGSVGAILSVLCLWALAAGAWPMAIYVAVAGGGFAWALQCNSRAGRVAQVIELHPTRIRVTESGPAARKHEPVELTPGWVRVVEIEGPWSEKRVFLRQSGRSIAIGDFLPEEERIALAEALRARIAALYHRR